MSKLQNMRLIEIPKFRAVSSGAKTLNELFGDNGFDSTWVKLHHHLLMQHMYEPTCFLWHEDINIAWDEGKNIFILAIKDDVTDEDAAPYEIVEFPGGMFLVAT
ncbi:MAG: hypothetical protein FWC96_04635, partial [Oscillospiraceae bacterium]|nr:hypothetical protein [Oscillospiraceae bacterium]